MVGCARPNRWLVEPDSTAGFTQRALVEMKETAKALLSKNKNELPAARTLYVSLDRADNVIEGGPGLTRRDGFGCAHPRLYPLQLVPRWYTLSAPHDQTFSSSKFSCPPACAEGFRSTDLSFPCFLCDRVMLCACPLDDRTCQSGYGAFGKDALVGPIERICND